ncbi:LysE/ArgO family amino acid transporter [Chitiniphilus shinanonensis]|uniref:LysE/ArgO family amino acid transporter n=4 Tax=Chitiniphilus shinanonensis TaxID=553088 RepID=UPI00035E7468|nr:LysE family transporter [Chitiniphilus shinanonensis]
MSLVYLQGLSLGGGLIVAIGAQNAHVLRMGLSRRHALLTAAVCALCDAALIAAGLAGMGALLAGSPGWLALARWGGAAYLAWFAWRALRAAFAPGALAAGADAGMGWRQALATALGFSLLNPHVYLDTVLLLGSVGAQHPWPDRGAFGLGAVTASFLWFFSLAGAAHALAPWFARPAFWRAIDLITALVMGALAVGLASGALGG